MFWIVQRIPAGTIVTVCTRLLGWPFTAAIPMAKGCGDAAATPTGQSATAAASPINHKQTNRVMVHRRAANPHSADPVKTHNGSYWPYFAPFVSK
jgi:hypothetical protein